LFRKGPAKIRLSDEKVIPGSRLLVRGKVPSYSYREEREWVKGRLVCLDAMRLPPKEGTWKVEQVYCEEFDEKSGLLQKHDKEGSVIETDLKIPSRLEKPVEGRQIWQLVFTVREKLKQGQATWEVTFPLPLEVTAPKT
jgi:hypothetical protein